MQIRLLAGTQVTSEKDFSADIDSDDYHDDGADGDDNDDYDPYL